MKQTVVFSGIESEYSYQVAVAFSKLPDYVVYVLHGKGERTITESDLNVIEIEERRRERLADAMKQIETCQGSIDMLIVSAGKHCLQDGKITQKHNYEKLLAVIDENVIGNLEVVYAALELMRKGNGKRIAFLTERESSINLNKSVEDYGYMLSLAALNMMEKVLFNTFRAEGFTFRCFACSNLEGISPEIYFRKNLCYDKDDAYIHSDENRLVMRDGMLCELSW